MAWSECWMTWSSKRASTGRGHATANNIIRTARATTDFFRKPRQGGLILFSQIWPIRNEGQA